MPIGYKMKARGAFRITLGLAIQLSATLLVNGQIANGQNEVLNSNPADETRSSILATIRDPALPGNLSIAAESPVTAPVARISGSEKALSRAQAAIDYADQLATIADRTARMAGVKQSAAAVVMPDEGNAFLDQLISRYATQHNIEPDLVRALIKVESNNNPLAQSPKGALGLMQLMPETARRYGVRDIFNSEDNLSGGVRYLSDLLRLFKGNIPLALSAYNAGENLVARIQRIPDYQETRDYVTRIGSIFDMKRSPYLGMP
jgi:soluble lytic murein transglycosylase-like protein